MSPSAPLTPLVSRASQGDAIAWRCIIDRFYPWTMRLARRWLPAGLQAEDAVQEAFLTAFRKLGQLRVNEAFPSWLAAIVRSQCLRMADAQPRTVSLDQDDVRDLLPTPGARTPEEALCSAEMLSAFDATLEDLPGHLRDVCRLHYRRGWSVPEVARACSLPEGTVKKRLFNARPLLQERMAAFRCETLFRVGYMPVSDHLLAMCADHLNQGRSLPLLSRRYLSWAALAADLARGRLDAAFIMAPLALSLREAGAQLLYVMDGHHDGSAISISRHTMRRQRIGLPSPFSTHGVLLHRFMREHPELAGLPSLVVNPSSIINSLQRNEIGSFFCAQPWSAKCVRDGIGDTVMNSRDILPGHLCCILVVRRDYAARQGQVVADYLRALYAARNRLRRNARFGAAVQSDHTGIDPDIARQVLDERIVSFDDLEPDEGRMKTFADMAHEAGVLSAPCDLSGFACADFLPRSSS